MASGGGRGVLVRKGHRVRGPAKRARVDHLVCQVRRGILDVLLNI